MSETGQYPKMIDLDASRSIDIDSLKLQYADKFASYTPKDKRPSIVQVPASSSLLPDGRPRKYKLSINPPLLNSSSPWATTVEDIQALYDSEYTGAVTTRTSLLEGFNHDDDIHQHVFFPAGSSAASPSPLKGPTDKLPATIDSTASSSLNTYGYSPHTLSEYLGFIQEVIGQRHLGTSTITKKPFILSVTGTPDEIEMSYALMANAAEMDEDLRLCMEVNLSCPNIDGKPPPAYDADMLKEYLQAISDSKSTYRGRMAGPESVPKVGIKLPPYTWLGQFKMVVSALLAVPSTEPGEGSTIDFLTCTNTLGSSLVMTPSAFHPTNPTPAAPTPTLASESGTGIGGLAGAAIHPLALGNVATFRKLLDEHPETENVMIIGVGGVEDKEGFERMRKVGAEAVGCATALGRFGVGVFEKISTGKETK